MALPNQSPRLALTNFRLMASPVPGQRFGADLKGAGAGREHDAAHCRGAALLSSLPQTKTRRLSCPIFRRPFGKNWCCLADSNRGPTDYESVALPTELRQPLLCNFPAAPRPFPPTSWGKAPGVPCVAVRIMPTFARRFQHIPALTASEDGRTVSGDHTMRTMASCGRRSDAPSADRRPRAPEAAPQTAPRLRP